MLISGFRRLLPWVHDSKETSNEHKDTPSSFAPFQAPASMGLFFISHLLVI